MTSQKYGDCNWPFNETLIPVYGPFIPVESGRKNFFDACRLLFDLFRFHPRFYLLWIGTYSKLEVVTQKGDCKWEGLYAPVWRCLLRGNPGNSPEVWRYTGRSDVALEWWIRHTSLLQRYVTDPCITYSIVNQGKYLAEMVVQWGFIIRIKEICSL